LVARQGNAPCSTD